MKLVPEIKDYITANSIYQNISKSIMNKYMLISDHLDKTKEFVQKYSLTEMKASKIYIEKVNQFHTNTSREWGKKEYFYLF